MLWRYNPADCGSELAVAEDFYMAARVTELISAAYKIKRWKRYIGGFQCAFLSFHRKGSGIVMDIKIGQAYLERAIKLHEENIVIDAHLDLAGEILLRKKNGEENIVKNHYLHNFKTAGMNLVFSSIYIENSTLEECKGEIPAPGWENALLQIEALKEDVRELPDVILIFHREDFERVLSEKKIGILIYMEGLDCIGKDLSRLDQLYDLGVRGASLTWSRKNALGRGCCKASEHCQIPGGLTQAGIDVIKRMEEKSMFLDISHLNDEGFDQVCRIAQRPFLATHSGSRRIFDNYRNLTDEQMDALAGQGGIMGVNGCKYIAGSASGNHLEMLCRHIEYEVEKVGEKHVGYGFDLCDSYDRARAALKGQNLTERDDCLLHHGQIPLLTAALLQRGMSEQELKCIIGGNFLEYLQKTVFSA